MQALEPYKIYYPSVKDKNCERILFSAMGTIMDFQAYGKNAKSALVKSVEIIKKLETLFSLKIETSEISRLNKNKFLKVSNETDELLKEALLLSQKTDCVYDLSIGVLTDLWDIKSIKKQIKKIPQKYEIEQALKTCGYKNVQYDNDNNYRLINNTKINLDSVAKGYASKKVCDFLKSEGIQSALLSLGTSSIAAFGKKPDNSLWKIGLRKPDNPNNYFEIVELEDEFLSTSAAYEQSFKMDGKTYHHIIDAKSGAPSNKDIVSVTVISKNAVKSEAYSTALFIMGIDKGLDFHQKIGNFKAIFIKKDGKKFVANGERALDNYKQS